MTNDNTRNEMDNEAIETEEVRPCLSRRHFLMSSSGAAVTSVLLSSCSPDSENGSGGGETGETSEGGAASGQEAEVASYPRKKVASVKDLATDKPITVNYPFDDLNSLCFLVKLGVPAGAGVGADSDIVAYSTLCTHMGGDFSNTDETYLKDHKLVGPCPLHLTTFDLRRHGMVVAGHATESLPQIVLEVEGDDVYATGVMGLIYGKRSNLDKSDI